jgi:hypothetical protein
MASKRQFLDPIGAGCRLILVYFSEQNTKIRIANHTIQLVPYNHSERMLYRPWFQDSRDDMCVLYHVMVRFIELYLLEKKEQFSKKSSNTTNSSGGGLFQFDNEDDDRESENGDDHSNKSDINITCYDSVKKLASYIIRGIACLAETYGYDNAVFTLQCFSNLLKAGIDGTYSSDMLPTHLKNSTTQNLLDISKIKQLWNDEGIVNLAGLFEKCFDAHEKKNNELVKGYRAAIIEILNTRDEEFKKIVSANESA